MPPKPLILGFDTSGGYCGTAVLADGECIAAMHEDMTKGQVERLMPMIEQTLSDAGANWRDLDAIGVGIGPGNFTGIRLSVSAARGLAMSLNIPAVGVNLLDALALGTDGPVLACLDARRGRAYVQGYGMAAQIPAQLVEISDLSRDVMEPGLMCIGSAAKDIAARLNAETAPAQFAPAAAIARIAAGRWQDNPSPPSPMYMRAADAAPASDPPPQIVP